MRASPITTTEAVFLTRLTGKRSEVRGSATLPGFELILVDALTILTDVFELGHIYPTWGIS
jgi:hypothetical protein